MSRAPHEVFPPVWTIYDRPADAPNKVVVRVWYGKTPGAALKVATLDEARRAAIEAGACFCLGRMPGDEPQIVESWI